MPIQATTAEGASPASSGTDMIDGAELLRAAELMDHQNPYDVPDEEPIAQQKPSQDETSGDREPDVSGAEKQIEKQDEAEPSAEQKEQPDTGPPRDEKGRFLPKDKSEQEPAVQPDDSKYAKAKKEEERQKSLLSNFESEKRKAREEIEAERQRLAQERAEIAKLIAIPRRSDGSPHEFNSQQYAKAADDFYARGRKAQQNGDIEQAEQLFSQAEQCSQASEQVFQAEQRVSQQEAVTKHESAWIAARDQAIRQNPELAWNNENPTPLNIEIDSLLKAPGNEFLYHLPHGFSIAAQVAKWKLQAAEVSALSEKLQQSEAEVERLRKLTGIKPAPSSGMPTQKAPELSEAQLLEWARIADAA